MSIKKIIFFVFLPLFIFAQDAKYIQVGPFNIEWFPCKEDGEMMKKYGINLRMPPKGNPTDIPALFNLLEELDIELIGVVEIVDPQMLQDSAKKYLGDQFKVIYAPSPSSQKVGFLYDSSVLEIIGKPQVYMDVALGPDTWLVCDDDIRVIFNIGEGVLTITIVGPNNRVTTGIRGPGQQDGMGYPIG